MGPAWNDLPAAERESIETRLALVVGSGTEAGLHGRAVAVEFIAWLHHYAPQLVAGPLKTALADENADAIALRSIFVGMSRSVGTDLRFLLRDEMFRGVEEYQADDSTAVKNAASRIVAEALDDLARENDDPAKLARGRAKRTLIKAGSGIRVGAANVLGDWLNGVEADRRTAEWRNRYKPVFTNLWPLDRKYQDERTSRALAKLAVAAREEFPDALDAVDHYLVPLTGSWPDLHYLTRDEAQHVIQTHPEKVLALLWCLLRPPASTGRSTDLAEIIDALKAADATLALDRRLQLLDERAARYR